MKKLVPAILFMLLGFGCFAQKAIKDTIIDSTTYRFASYNSNGKLKTLSQNRNREGQWIYFNKDGVEERSGGYDKSGRKDGEWRYIQHEITYYKNGKVIKKGVGCNHCPPF